MARKQPQKYTRICKNCGKEYSGSYCMHCGKSVEDWFIESVKKSSGKHSGNTSKIGESQSTSNEIDSDNENNKTFKEWFLEQDLTSKILLVVIAFSFTALIIALPFAILQPNVKNQSILTTSEYVAVPDFTKMNDVDIQEWKKKNNMLYLDVKRVNDYSDSVPKGQVISQTPNSGTRMPKDQLFSVTIHISLGKKPAETKESTTDKDSKKDVETSSKPATSSGGSTSNSTSSSQRVPSEYTSAFRVAKEYLGFAPLSRQKLYEQLTEYENFSNDAAQYALNNLDVNYNVNALRSAREYLSYTDMSDDMLYDQLTSPYGDAFTHSEAQYAFNHL